MSKSEILSAISQSMSKKSLFNPTMNRSEANMSRSSLSKRKSLLQDSNHHVINELSAGEYFGELSLISNLPATSTIHVVNSTIC